MPLLPQKPTPKDMDPARWLAAGATSETHTEARATLNRRDHQTYRTLIRACARLPPLSPRHSGRGGLSPGLETMFYEELLRRGAFDIKIRLEDGLETTDTCGLWAILREQGYVWRPRAMNHGTGLTSHWSIKGYQCSPTIDAEEYDGEE